LAQACSSLLGPQSLQALCRLGWSGLGQKVTMGVIGKLAFWRKSGKRSQTSTTAVEPFNAEAEEPLTKKTPPALEEVEVPSSASTSSCQAANPQEFEESPKSIASSSIQSAPVRGPPEQPSPVHSISSPVQTKQPTLQTLQACTAADVAAEAGEAELEAEMRPRDVTAGRESFVAKLPADEQDAVVSFDVTVEQVFSSVTQAFGPMISSSLQSPKWDKRAQALKAVGTMLRGLDLQGMAPPGSTGVLGKGLRLRDRVCCWRTCCQLLHHVLRDKVMPVRLAAHELYIDAFSNSEGLVSQAEVHFAIGVLLEHMLDRLGDSNLRLHESARKCVLFSAEHAGLLGLDELLAKLRQRLQPAGRAGDRAKVHHGVLDAVNLLLQHFPGRRSCRHSGLDEDEDEADDVSNAPSASWTSDDIAPFIIAGMDDNLGQRTRSTAVALAVTVYQTFGMEAMQPLFAGLRPAKQALLKQKFEEIEGLDLDDEDDGTEEDRTRDFSDLMICGSAVKICRPPPLPGSVHEHGDDEEMLMDGILEEAGMVFNGTGIMEEGFGYDNRSLRPVPGLRTTLLEEEEYEALKELEAEHKLLEEELLNIGIDLHGIDEQEALLVDCLEQSKGPMASTEVPIEVC